MNKPQTLKGFRDFLPDEKRKRDWVAKKIIQTFETFGFEPLETPTLEYASLLLGKYGQEADKLVYTFDDKGDRRIGLRYDQTVPTARVLGQYQNQLPKYFRRYQMQNVFRADKPQKGRYREFTQCDIDIFGSTSSLADAEIIACTYWAYKNIGFPKVYININDRQTLLNTLSPFATDQVSVFSIIQSIDKLDKLSPQQVSQELVDKGLTPDNASQAIDDLTKSYMSPQLSSIIDAAVKLGVNEDDIIFDPKLARGLDYYTGMIFEVIIPNIGLGSCGGGGRYDNLIADLTGQNMPAVGVAFGFDRTVEAAQTLALIPPTITTAKVLISVFDDKTQASALNTACQLRQAGIATEVYPEAGNLGKQFKLASQKQIPFVIVIGEQEIKEGKIAIKDMKTGSQELVDIDQAIKQLKNV